MRRSHQYFQGMGCYHSATARFNQWTLHSIYEPVTRKRLAEMVREVRDFGKPGEAYAFLGHFKYMGTFPVINSGSWINRYGRSTAVKEY